MNAWAKSDNHVLSLIHAENNYDYYTWKELNNSPLKNIKNNRNILKKIIVNSWDRKDKIFINESFIYNVISNLNKLNKGKCEKIKYQNSNLQSFEITYFNVFNSWINFCKKKDFNPKKFKANISQINPSFKNVLDLNFLSYLYFNDKFNLIKDYYENINLIDVEFISINLREVYFINKIIKELNLNNYKLHEFENQISEYSNSNSISKFYTINNYKDLIYEQTFQLANYYEAIGMYEEALALYSLLSEFNNINKDFYELSKFSLSLKLYKNIKNFNILKKYNTKINKLNFSKTEIFIKNARYFGYGKNEIIKYFNEQYNKYSDEQTLSLAFEISAFIVSSYSIREAVDFLESCCLDMIKNSSSIEHLFRYGALLERINRIPEAEKFIQKSLEISGNLPNPIILNYLAYLWVEMDKNFQQAEDMLIQAVASTEGNNGAILDSLGWLYFKQNNIPIAEKWVGEAYLLEPGEPEIIDHLSQIYKSQGRDRDAKYLDAKILNFHKDYFKIDSVIERNYEN